MHRFGYYLYVLFYEKHVYKSTVRSLETTLAEVAATKIYGAKMLLVPVCLPSIGMV